MDQQAAQIAKHSFFLAVGTAVVAVVVAVSTKNVDDVATYAYDDVQLVDILVDVAVAQRSSCF